MSDAVLYAVEKGLAVITLNRPKRRNAMSREMADAYDQVLVGAAIDSGVRVIIITGEGAAFCSGGDIDRLKETATGGAPQVRSATEPNEFFHVFEDMAPEYRSRYTFPQVIPKPIIAAVNGLALGAGFHLALHCDIRFCSTDGAFQAGFGRIGATPEGGMNWSLPRAIGIARATEMLLSGRRVGAQEALQWGLVTDVFESGELLPRTMAYAREIITTTSPRSINITKQRLRQGCLQTFGEAYFQAAQDAVDTRSTHDFIEGLSAFQEKRAPKFLGR